MAGEGAEMAEEGGHGAVKCHKMGNKLCHHMVYSFWGKEKEKL